MNPQVNFFNSIAHNWDNIVIVDERKINYALEELEIAEGDRILDVGTGTGVMIPFLLERIGKEGKITAVDIAENMLNIAKEKFQDEDRVKFLKKDIEVETIDELFNSIICYSVFPHFCHKVETIKNLVDNCLEKEGRLLIFHSQSKEEINRIHEQKDPIVSEDKLIDFVTQKLLFEKAGINVLKGVDNEDMYLIIIKK